MKKLTFTDYPVLTTPIDSDNLNLVQTNIAKAVDTGWVDAEETWTYASATTISINADMTGILRKGDKIKLTQTTLKYFYVVSVGAYSGGNTIITITGGSDYVVANEVITISYYSHASTPIGFPSYFNWSPTTGGITKGAGGTLNTTFTINGNVVNFYINFVFGTGSAISGRNTFTLPINGVDALSYGTTLIFDAGTAVYSGLCEIGNSSLAVDSALANGTYITGAYFSSTVPMTWTTNDHYTAKGWYFI